MFVGSARSGLSRDLQSAASAEGVPKDPGFRAPFRASKLARLNLLLFCLIRLGQQQNRNTRLVPTCVALPVNSAKIHMLADNQIRLVIESGIVAIIFQPLLARHGLDLAAA